MKIPKFLLGAAALFWGWQTGHWLFAGAIALILEASRWLNLRWDLSAKDFKRVANLCLILVIVLIIYLLLTSTSMYFIYDFIQLLPLVFLPLLMAQAYSVSERVDMRTLLLMFDKTIEQEDPSKFKIDFSYLYFILCFMSASTINPGNHLENLSFYGAMFILAALALWSLRSPRYSPRVWLSLMLVAGTVGFVSYLGLYQLHVTLENMIVNWYYDNYYQGEVDPFKKETNIGEFGPLKQSNDISFRVASETPLKNRLLIREAIYNQYKSSRWFAYNDGLTWLKPDNNQTSWTLAPQPDSTTTITIFSKLHGGRGLLKLPNGTVKISHLPVTYLEQNQYGTVRVEGKNRPIAYQVKFNRDLSLDSLPTEEDLYIGESEKATIEKIIAELDTQGKSEAEILQIVDRFIQKNFTYSLNLTSPENYLTPLSSFLLKSRSGHCEYFATATALILRSLGIPARYAVGYSVHEFSQLEHQYIVRSRHAHAWTLAYVDGKWQAFDTTPANWTSFEDAQISQLAIVGDLWSFLTFKLSRWFQIVMANNYLKYGGLIGLVSIVIILRKVSPQKLVRRLSKQSILRKRRKSNEKKSLTPMSDFDLIEKALQDIGFMRTPSEPLKNWIHRLEIEQRSQLIAELMPIVELHYRDRFDPQGIDSAERKQLKNLMKSWLERLEQYKNTKNTTS
jgi:hypothetical protein